MARGMTLIEVLAALVVLAVLLGGVLLAKGGAERQWAAADRRLAALAAADELLHNGWSPTGLTLPLQGQGRVPGKKGLVWQTAVVPDAGAEAWNTRVVRLTISGEQGGRAWATVDVLVPVEPANEAAGDAQEGGDGDG